MELVQYILSVRQMRCGMCESHIQDMIRKNFDVVKVKANAAGCMIYVIGEEMIPETKSETHDHFGVWSFILGFIIMMVLDSIQL